MQEKKPEQAEIIEETSLEGTDKQAVPSLKPKVLQIYHTPKKEKKKNNRKKVKRKKAKNGKS